MSTKPPIAVVGAGIIGACVAWQLQSEGRSVRLIDREAPGKQASYGNMACIAVTEFLPLSRPATWINLPRWLLDRDGPIHIRPAYLPRLLPWMIRFLKAGLPGRRHELEKSGAALCKRAAQDFLELISATQSSDLLSDTRGCLRLYRNAKERETDSSYLTALENFGFNHRLLDREQLMQLEPQLSREITQAALLPQWMMVKDPYTMTLRIIDRFVSHGGAVERAEVIGFGRDAGTVSNLKFSAGPDLPVSDVILACGAWTHRLAHQLNDDMPLETERGYHAQFTNPSVSLRHALVNPTKAFVVAPVAGGIRVGGTIELGGLDACANFCRAKILIKQAKMLLPALNTEESTEWMGHRPALPDTIPVIGRATHLSNAYYATGHGHLGLTLAATTARLVSELIAGKVPSTDITPFRANRF